MAEHIKQAESPYDELKMNFSCQICNEQYTKNNRFPLTLNCGHTFCVNCIKRLCQNRRTIQCGNCRKNTYSDYRKLGKNIVLLELLEFNDLIGNDENNELTLDKLGEEEQHQWEDANQFIGRSEFEEFYTNLNDTEILVSELPYSNKKSRMKRQIEKARDDIKNVENQLNSASDAYRRVMNEVRELRDHVNYEIAQLQMDIYDNNEQFGRISPDTLIYRPPSDDSEEDDGSYQRPTTSLFRRNRRRRNTRIRCGGVQFEFHYTNWREQIQIAQQNVPEDNGDWGGSSDGWGSNREERTTMDVQPRENQNHGNPPPMEMLQIPITQESQNGQQDDDDWGGSSDGWGSNKEENEQPEENQNHGNPAPMEMPQIPITQESQNGQQDDDDWGGSSDGWGSNKEENEQPEENQNHVVAPNNFQKIPTTHESQNLQPAENDDWDRESSNGWSGVQFVDEQPRENRISHEVKPKPPVEMYRKAPRTSWIIQ